MRFVTEFFYLSSFSATKDERFAFVEQMDSIEGQGNFIFKDVKHTLVALSLTGRLVFSYRGSPLNLVRVETPTKQVSASFFELLVSSFSSVAYTKFPSLPQISIRSEILKPKELRI